MNLEATTARRDSFRVHTTGQLFQTSWRTTLWQITKTKSWRVVGRVPSSFTTGPYGMDIRRICPTSLAVQYKELISGVKHGQGSICLSACVLTLSPASVRLRVMY